MNVYVEIMLKKIVVMKPQLIMTDLGGKIEELA